MMIFIAFAEDGNGDRIDSSTLIYEDDDDAPGDVLAIRAAYEDMQRNPGYDWALHPQPITIKLYGPIEIDLAKPIAQKRKKLA